MTVARHCTALAAAMALLLLLCGCRPEPSGAPATSEKPGPAIPHPLLDDMEPAVRSVLEAQRAEVDALLARPGLPEAELARAMGQMGRLYQVHRLVEAAAACYREAHALDPERFEWAYYLGVLAARQSNLEEAVGALEDALALRPRDLPALIRLADLELDRGEIDRAQAFYQRARSLDPSMAAVEFGLGRVAAERGRYQEAIERFEAALALQPRASAIHYHLGQAYRRLGQLDQATSHLDRSGPQKVALPDPLMSAVNALATGSSTYLTQANFALREGRLSVAVDAFRRALAADPESSEARQGLAAVFMLLRDLDGATEQLEAVVRLAPDNAQAHADLGSILAERGDEEGALAHLGRAVELEPGHQPARLGLANALARLGRYADAAEHYRRLLEIDPDHVEARARLGTVLAEAGKPQQAITELRRVARQDPGKAEAQLNLGIALADAGDLEEAVAQHLKVLGLPDAEAYRGQTLINLGTLRLRQGDRSKALEHFRQAVEHDDRLVPAHLNAANLLASGGRLEEALPHFARVRELQPGQKNGWLGGARALMFLGRFADARALLEQAVEALPDEPAATHALARLLAAAPDGSLRDGPRALSLVARALEAAARPAYVETQAMALAEAGRFADAVARQRAVLAEAGERGRTRDAERLARNLARYESGVACCARAQDAIPTN